VDLDKIVPTRDIALLQPALLALTALLAIRSRARTGAAALGLAVALLPAALAEAEDRLSPEPPFWWRECLEAQLTPPSFAVPRLALAWLLSPATMVLLAGIAGAGIRLRLTDLRNAGTATAAVLVAAFLPGVLMRSRAMSGPARSSGTGLEPANRTGPSRGRSAPPTPPGRRARTTRRPRT
jgi:hypothetical protein